MGRPISGSAAIAIPAYQDYVVRAKLSEASTLWMPVREKVEEYVAYRGEFPRDNEEAGLLAPHQLAGAYVAEVHVDDGAIRVQYRASVWPEAQGGSVTIRPVLNADEPTAPITWECPTSADLPQKFVIRC